MGSEIYNFLWRGKNPPPMEEGQPLTTEKVRDLTEGVKSISALAQAIQSVQGLGGARMEKPSEVIKEANELLNETEKFQQRTNPQPTSPAEQIKGMREAMEEAKKLTDIVEGKKEGTEKKRYTVLDDGSILPDPDGELTLTEALIASRNLRQSTSPSYYYQDETGQFQEAKGPVAIHQPTPPEVWMVTDGEARKLQPGEPIIVKPAAPAPARIFLMKPDGTMEEHDPNKPIIVKTESAPPAAPQSPPFPVQPVDSDGKPIGGVIPLPIPQYIEYIKGLREVGHEDEKHKMFMDLMATFKEEIPRITRAVDRQSKKGGRRTESSKEAGEEMDIRRCRSCDLTFATPKNLASVACPNPDCPSHKEE